MLWWKRLSNDSFPYGVMARLEDIVGERNVFRTVGEYRVGVTATILAPCAAGVLVGVCERFGIALPVQPEALTYGALAGAACVMGYLFARRANLLARERELNPALSGIAALLSGTAVGAAYGAFAWVAHQLGYWDVRIFTANF